MFIAILTYKKPLEEVDRFRQATPRVGGVIMIKTECRAAVDPIIAQDPFNVNGIADYQIVEFTPTMFCDAVLSNFLL